MYGFIVLPALSKNGGTAPITINTEKIVCVAQSEKVGAIVQLENMAIAVDMTVKEVTDALNAMWESSVEIWVAPGAYDEKEPSHVIIPKKDIELLH